MAHGDRNDHNDCELYEPSNADGYSGNHVWSQDVLYSSRDDGHHVLFCNARIHAHAVYAGCLSVHEQKIHQRLQTTKPLPL